ncbi:hypothetical protein LHYA1_G003583 [Lachnellula hyalina]|uniref:Uncharacterized protein n=1 Tax=Lachnellula hyalina TaxID=1316788 RepID=A0A8H8TXU3_9HELO|nr:uncharacterized protein LHYA1_G003583 [Lachnellula hyalina]TVY26424.1 hypothetical protein LHYA1_G003583 [Lachnellula hyalina]
MASSSEDLSRRPYAHRTAATPTKHALTRSQSSSVSPKRATLPPIQTIIQIPEDQVWGLRKEDLRNYFLALQGYILHPYPLGPLSPPPTNLESKPSGPADLPPLLKLPIEIRTLVYTHLLPPSCSPPIRGPHPRQLQNYIHLSQPIPSNLLRLNHQIRSEALPLLYGSPSQTVYIKIDYNVWVHKTRRSDLILTSALTSCIRNINLSIHLGSEKRANRPVGETYARLQEVKKGIKKLDKWLSGADIQRMEISWQEPPQTFTWPQKKEVLDGLRAIRAVSVLPGEINWGLDWNKGRRFRFEVEYLKELERVEQSD